jgi:hypothetical protein
MTDGAPDDGVHFVYDVIETMDWRFLVAAAVVGAVIVAGIVLLVGRSDDAE